MCGSGYNFHVFGQCGQPSKLRETLFAAATAGSAAAANIYTSNNKPSYVLFTVLPLAAEWLCYLNN